MPTDLRDALHAAAPQDVPVLDFDPLWRRHRRARVLRVTSGVAVAAAVAVAAFGLAGRLVADPHPLPADQPPAEHDDVPAEQMTVIREMVDAINARDTDALIGVFAPEGAFDARGQFAETSLLFRNHLPVADVDLVRAWVAIVDAWGLEAQLISCAPQAGTGGYDGSAVVGCEVATRWHTLSMEITEGWGFELRGAELLWWDSMAGADLELLDLDPPDRALPLGYDGLEAWEAWLQANHPEDATRFLNPREKPPNDCDGCEGWVAGLAPGDRDRAARLALLMWNAQDGWTIDNHPFTPIGLIPYDPALADEIEASIREYLEEQ